MEKQRLIFSALALALIGCPRQVSVPPPVPKTGTEVWLAPNRGSVDLLEMFSRPDQWPQARQKIKVFKFYAQELLDGPDPGGSRNTLANLTDLEAFSKLSAWGLETAVETGVVKEWDCDGSIQTGLVKTLIANVAARGGAVSWLAFDEPYFGGEATINGRHCGNTMQQTASAVARFVTTIHADYPAVGFGDIEPYPAFGVPQLLAWVEQLKIDGVRLSFLHLDIDSAAVSLKTNLASDMLTLRSYCLMNGIRFGVIFISPESGRTSDQAYHDGVLTWLAIVKDAMGWPSQSIFQSWLCEAYPQCTVPRNLPETAPYTHTRIVLEAAP